MLIQKVGIAQSNQRSYAKADPNFMAKLKVDFGVEKASKASFAKFNEVIGKFRAKLAADPLNASDVVKLSVIDPKDANAVVTGASHTYTPGKWVGGGYCQQFVPETVKYGYGNQFTKVVTKTYTPMENENLQVSINKSKCGFYFNNDHSAEQISEDLYNTYKHVRYLEHYKK